MNPRQGNIRLRSLAAFTVALALIASYAPAANADESTLPTAQATAYNADWVPYLDPPEKPAAVCLVDSGVNITPDTPADNPEGPIVKRLSLDGGPGTAANATWEGLHGTRMAFVGAAPINGWGAVGFWPGARIISIRAMPLQTTIFPFDAYSRAADVCTKHAKTYNVAVINLSLACDCTPTAAERSRLELQVANAHNNDQSVVAAVGNSGGAVSSPADTSGILAVAAGDRLGALCSFSNRGAAVDLLAPGCDIDLADPNTGQPWSGYQSGSSGASLTTSAALALLRSYRPELDWHSAEQLVQTTAHNAASGAVLDVEGLLRAANLGSLVDAAKARAPKPTQPGSAVVWAPNELSPMAPASGDREAPAIVTDLRQPLTSSLPVPRVRALSERAAGVMVAVLNRPARARLVAVLQSRRGEFGYVTIRRVARRASKVLLRLPRPWRGGRVLVRYELRGQSPRTSVSVARSVPR